VRYEKHLGGAGKFDGEEYEKSGAVASADRIACT